MNNQGRSLFQPTSIVCYNLNRHFSFKDQVSVSVLVSIKTIVGSLHVVVTSWPEERISGVGHISSSS